jgi:hypothetical protein
MPKIQAIITFDESWDKETVLQIFEPGNSISQGIIAVELIDNYCKKMCKSEVPTEKRDCDTCINDGECFVTMLQCKGYKQSSQI